ncbi:hypothetical protein JFL43_09030 [Viridibacillus sp. YIM B01967]|uniref:Uncharacterized protein n=1 Tax=Viridibacillus soli TaxID=2798301 RepID=A0ABS1H6H1_9BACL|nr:hypothetical protein [Viridibacillus soli]MBK3495001.1 hypothetical protein [Viridibacillus soli]
MEDLFQLVETDERVQHNSLKFLAQVLGLSHIIAAITIVVLLLMNQSTIQTEFILYYIVGILFLTMTIGYRLLENYKKGAVTQTNTLVPTIDTI